MKKKILIVLQARIQSYRLPAKVLMPLSKLKLPLAVLCSRRLSNLGHKVILAIPSIKKDDILNKTLKKYKLETSRGSHKNVFSRYLNATKKLRDNDIVIRATSDNPLPDGSFIKKTLNFFRKNKLDYLDTHKIFNLPYGVVVQVFYVKVLRELNKRPIIEGDKEHVCVTMSKKKFNYKKYKSPYNFKKKIKKKLSIDNYQDYKRIKKLFENIKDPVNTKWESIVR
tara:strand:+ start:1032 stop:1706 length:675 start_codon:yes stop_codon:yes gene_type:complete